MTHKKYTIGQSFAGYIRQHLPDIEQKLAVGIRYVTLHKGFVAMGFDVTLDTMRGALYRARLARDGVKSRKDGAAEKPKVPAPKTTTTAKNAVTPAKDYFARESVFSQRKG